MGTTGGWHCADASEGRRQGATAASAVGDAARALRAAVLQPERSGDGGSACEAESIRRFAGAVLEKVLDETTIPTSATGWSAADWCTCRSGDPGSLGRAGGGGVLKKGTIISAPSDRLLHGEEEQVRGDSGYRGIGKRAEHAHRDVSRQIALTPGQRRTLAPGSTDSLVEKARLGCVRGWSIRSGSRAGVRLRHDSVSRSEEERATACAASGLLEPDDCPAAPVVTREKRVRNLPGSAPRELNRRRFSPENAHLGLPDR